ncbi:hypothetical protein RRG08_029238 [Elysia crispata]|uniref:Uncharacterized protein n=1 Tax=Elysia crispata TaxID=231223 RepID=A0AAE1E088_9GAST|nr:hypothetical protein RRG08_029238 [Elysia crispata]
MAEAGTHRPSPGSQDDNKRPPGTREGRCWNYFLREPPGDLGDTKHTTKAVSVPTNLTGSHNGPVTSIPSLYTYRHRRSRTFERLTFEILDSIRVIVDFRIPGNYFGTNRVPGTVIEAVTLEVPLVEMDGFNEIGKIDGARRS